MKKHGVVFIGFFLGTVLLTGCMSGVWTGASLLYNRHDVYKKMHDYQLGMHATQALYADALLKQSNCSIDLAVFKGDILLAGHVPTMALRQEALARVASISGYRRLFNQVAVNQQPSNALADGWITTKIRTQIVANSELNPDAFKVVTSDSIVYLMGDVEMSQALQVITMARNTTGVKRVVRLFKYYTLSSINKNALEGRVNASNRTI